MKDRIFSKIENIFGIESLEETSGVPIIVPAEKEMISQLINFAENESIKISIIGGGTELKPYHSTDSIWISTKKINKIREINTDDFLVISESGVIVDNLIKETDKSGLHIPLELPCGVTSTVGGAYMTGAYGLAAKKYGSFRDIITGASFLDSEGRNLSFGGRTAKNVTGYEMTRFMAGSYGIFAINTDVTIKIFPTPEKKYYTTYLYSGFEHFISGIKQVMKNYNDLTSFEVYFNNDSGNTMSFTVGFEGLGKIVERNNKNLRNSLINDSVVDVIEKQYDSFCSERRDFYKNQSNQEMWILSFPPKAVDYIIDSVNKLPGKFSLAGNPAFGKMFLYAEKNEKIFEIVEKAILSSGGKKIRKFGDKIFTVNDEYGVDLSDMTGKIKKQLDPGNLFNNFVRNL